MEGRPERNYLHRLDPYNSRGKDVAVSTNDYWEITDCLLD